jgi:hypothetical protein
VGILRLFLRDHRRFAALLVALALAMKALVPSGYMIGGDVRVITISICADSIESRYTKQILVPQSGKADHAKDGLAKDGQACPFSALSMASLAGADPVLLALALAFILTLGFYAAFAPHRRRTAHLRPPLRGPPATV